MDERTVDEALGAPSTVQIELPQRSALDWNAMVGWLDARTIRGVEAVTRPQGHPGEPTFRRTVDIGGRPGSIELRHTTSTTGSGVGSADAGSPPPMLLTVRLPGQLGPTHLEGSELAQQAQRMLAAELHMDDALEHLGSDTALGSLVNAQPALRPPGCWDPFEATVRAVLGQQITVSGARTIAGRLAERAGTPVVGLDHLGLDRLFPGPEELRDADLDGIGLTSARIVALRGVAEAALDGFDFHGPGLAERLRELRGIGDWTAQYVALRMGEPDAFPSSDIGLRKAAGRLMGVERLGVSELEELSRRWRPWRSVAAIHLWWSLSLDPPTTV